MTADAEPRLSPMPWLVRAGRGAQHLQRFVGGGFVSISWATIPHLGDLRDHDDDEILGLLRAAGRGQPAADLRELVGFRDGIEVGDVVVTVDTPARELVFGYVTGGYVYEAVPVVGDHRHLRSVRWVGRWPRELLDESLAYTLRHYQRTVLELPHPDAWLALAERAGIGGGVV